MIYFIAQDVCDKLRLRSAKIVFSTHGLIEGRDYIKFSPKDNSTLYRDLVYLKHITPDTKMCYLLTVPGLMELLFKCKSLEAKKVKDAILNTGDYSIYASTEWKVVNQIVGNLTSIARGRFYTEESYACEKIRETIELTPRVLECIKKVRDFANAGIKESDSEEYDVSIDALIDNEFNFKYFVI